MAAKPITAKSVGIEMCGQLSLWSNSHSFCFHLCTAFIHIHESHTRIKYAAPFLGGGILLEVKDVLT